MLKETGKVAAIDSDALWIEAIQKSTCGSCVAQKGCGQTLMSRLGVKPVYIRVLLNGREADDYRVGQSIDIAIADDVVVKTALFTYFSPVICSLVFASVAYSLHGGELTTLLSAIVGLVTGMFAVRIYAKRHHDDPRYQPVIIGENTLIASETPRII
jgi:sigma-E factor negative regulatory protein RseC